MANIRRRRKQQHQKVQRERARTDTPAHTNPINLAAFLPAFFFSVDKSLEFYFTQLCDCYTHCNM